MHRLFDKINHMIRLFFAASLLISCAAQSGENTHVPISNNTMQTSTDTSKNIFGFSVRALDGGTIDFSTFRGKKILVVNTASECGYTPQYKDLEALFEQYKDKLVIVGFPANNFGGQEPGSNEEIKSFCQKNYGVSFPMAAKISVKGDDIAPIYQWLTHKDLNGVLDAEVKWNFNKFLLDEQGRLIGYFESRVNPLSDAITGKL